MDQTNLLENMVEPNSKYRLKTKEGKGKKRDTFDSVSALYEGRELTLSAYRSIKFPIREKKGKRTKILTPKQMLRKLPIALAQVKAGSTCENVLNEIRQIIYYLYRAKEVIKTSDLHRLLLKLTDKIDLRRRDKYFALSNLSIYYKCKNVKTSYKNNKFKISVPTWNEEFELPDGSYSISDIQDYFEYIFKQYGEKTVNPSIKNICKQNRKYNHV